MKELCICTVDMDDCPDECETCYHSQPHLRDSKCNKCRLVPLVECESIDAEDYDEE